MSHVDTQAVKPAWKNKWFWLVAGLPLTAVVASLITMYLAISSSDGVVDDNYYKEGLAINTDLRRDEMALTYGINGQMQLEGDVAKVKLNYLPAAKLAGQPLRLVILNKGLAKLDLSLALLPTNQAGEWQAKLPNVPQNGFWTVRVENDAWRISQDVKGNLNGVIKFN